MADKFLIIGALGCIGAWTARRLLDEGVDVVAYDLPGDPHRLKLIMPDEQVDKITFVEGDVTDQAGLEAAVKNNDITHIIHLAALQVPSVRANPVLGMKVNVVGTTIVFEVAKQFAGQVQSVAYASSVAVYGPASEYLGGPIAFDSPLLPTTLYGVTKEANEWTAKIYWRDYKVRSVGVRPAYVYGPGRDVGMTSTPTKAMLAAAAGQPYHISFGGTGFFQHADDVAKSLIQAARSSVNGAPTFNLGGTKVSIEQAIEAITAAAPESEGTITAETNQLPFPDEYDGAPLDAAIGTVGWRSFAEGTKQTIEHFRQAIADGRIDVDRAIA
ncbi:MAG: NAD-dependent epimerase/dehydratase family protein [Chloroflexota bacterium]|nr:NAD-dependent epimerase/dehydratase family protein [Chloroflexota bacterium]